MSVGNLKRALIGPATATLAFALVALGGAAPAHSQETCSNDKHRTGPSLKLPDCRAYEMVTPVKKYDQIIAWPTGDHIALPSGEVAASGDGIAFNVGQGRLAEDPTSGAIGALERAFRTEDGWEVERTIAPPDLAYTSSGVIPKWAMFSDDLTKVAFNGSARFSPLQLPEGGVPDWYGGAFLSDGTTNTWLSQPTWDGAIPVQGTTLAQNNRWRVDGGSSSLDTVYFASTGTHTTADATSGRPADESWALYKWKDGELTNAGILPDGTLSPGGSILADVAATVGNPPTQPLVPSSPEREARSNSVSSDGRRFLFVSPDPYSRSADPSLPEPQLYLAEEGQPTKLLSRRLDSPGQEPVAGTTGVTWVSALGSASSRMPSMVMATPDLGVVVFRTQDVLTESAEGSDPAVIKTYMYEEGTLTYIPEMNHPPSLQERGNLISLAPDGHSLLYVTPDENLKLWRRNASTLQISSEVTAVASSLHSGAIQAVRFFGDGSKILLQSTAPLRGETRHLPPTGSTNIRQHLYVYDIEGDSLTCVSCKAGFETSQGAVFSGAPNFGIGGGSNAGTRATARAIATDGTFVFTTDIPLLEEDRNEMYDVYRWKDGDLALISSGDSAAADQVLYDISESGRDIFIASREQLVPWDIDRQYDIYTARIGGGLDAPVDGYKAPCLGDDCQGASLPRPTAPVLGSVVFGGDGNLQPGENANRALLRLSRLKTVRGPVARLRVRVPGAGRISVVGGSIRNAGRSVSKAGSHTLRISLSRKARRSLHKKGRLKVRVRVSYRSEAGARSAKAVRVTFRQPTKAKRAKRSVAGASGEGR